LEPNNNNCRPTSKSNGCQNDCATDTYPHEFEFYTNIYFFSVCIYIAFRTPNPEEEILDDMKKDLKKYDLDFNQLVKWDVNHCEQKKYREHRERVKGKN
jgi:hypothetical protein